MNQECISIVIRLTFHSYLSANTVKMIAVLKSVQSLYTCHVQAVINKEQNKVNKFDHRLYTSWKFLYMLSGTGLEVIKLPEQNIIAY